MDQGGLLIGGPLAVGSPCTVVSLRSARATHVQLARRTHALPAGRHGLAAAPARAAERVRRPGGTDREAALKATGLDLEHVQTDAGFPKLTFGKVVKISSVQRGGGSGGGGGGGGGPEGGRCAAQNLPFFTSHLEVC